MISGKRFVPFDETVCIMTTQQIAGRLVELCRAGEFKTAVKELYSDDAVSIEPYATPEFEKETKGRKALEEKDRKFSAMVQEWHGVEISDPLIAGNVIAFTMTMDITMKGKDRMKMAELCVYQVKDGKIVQEQFFM